jgi:hypothetical protein
LAKQAIGCIGKSAGKRVASVDECLPWLKMIIRAEMQLMSLVVIKVEII